MAMINIQRDNTSRTEKWLAVTDKGVIYGGSKEIVERKIKRLGAGEKTYSSNAEHREIYLKTMTKEEKEDADSLPF